MEGMIRKQRSECSISNKCFSNTVRDKEYLKEMRITHVVNTSEGRRPGMVDVNAQYFRDIGVTYLGLPIVDMPSANIQDYFSCTSEFIHEALHNGGK